MVAPAPFDYDRGKPLRVRQSVEALVGLGFEVDVLAYPSGRDVDRPGVQVTRAPGLFATDPSVPGFTWRSLLSDAALLGMAVRALRSGGYDAVHAHDIDGAVVSETAVGLTRSSLPVVYDMHGAFSELADHYGLPLPGGVVDRLERFAYGQADHVILNWPHLRGLVSTDTPKTLILDHPPEALREAITGSPSLQEAWGDSPYVLYTGNYAPYQGVDLLLAAFERLVDELPADADPPQLVLTGDAPAEIVVDRADVHFVGFVEEPRLAALLEHAAALASPRLTEGFPPMKINTYRLTDNPLVVTNRGCHTSVLADEDGVYFAEPTPTDLARAMREAMEREAPIDREGLFGDPADAYGAVYESILR